MEIDSTIARVKDLIAQRERIDAQLSELLVVAAKRGRPRKAETHSEEPKVE